MQLKTYSPNGSNDAERMKDAFDQLKNHNFCYLSDEDFDDKSLVISYNEMVESLADENNKMVMRLNDAQIRIADNSTMRALIDGINKRQTSLTALSNANDLMQANSSENDGKKLELLSLSKQANATLAPVLEYMEHVSEAMADGDLDKIKNAFEIIESFLTDAIEQVERLNRVMMDFYKTDGSKSEFFRQFDSNIDDLVTGHSELLKTCYENGSRLYRISRDIDNARNDMYRWNSAVSLIDQVKIFSVDHLTVAWRLFNNIIEYERLKIEQINNQDRCKYGLWCANMENPLIKESAPFKAAFDAHLELHRHAVLCFVAKEASDQKEAVKEFELVLEEWKNFNSHLEELIVFLKENGFEEETTVWKFQ